jgi:DnaJ homolog subfamily B member 12
MEANRQESTRALDVARRHLQSDPPNLPSAIKFCKKSLSLYESKEGFELLERLEKLQREDGGNANTGPSASTSGTNVNGSVDGMRKRKESTPSLSSSGPSTSEKKESRTFTKAQVELVNRIRKCKVTEYYEILQLEKGCGEDEIKKSYKKVGQNYGDEIGCDGFPLALVCSFEYLLDRLVTSATSFQKVHRAYLNISPKWVS